MYGSTIHYQNKYQHEREYFGKCKTGCYVEIPGNWTNFSGPEIFLNHLTNNHKSNCNRDMLSNNNYAQELNTGT